MNQFDKKITDLLEKMSIEEKARQLDQYAASDFYRVTEENGEKKISFDEEKTRATLGGLGVGIVQDNQADPDLLNAIQKFCLENSDHGIPALFCAEGLHGVSVPGSTIFPQQICLASTFDPTLAYQTGAAIGAEARSYGLHEIWTPVLDLARDPRWGRTEETYGEDTYLGAKLAEQIVKGMQKGDVSREDAVVSEPKHFAAYGVSFGGINCAPAAIGKRDMYTDCLPIFEAAFIEGGAMNTMCSYSSVDGIPCSGDKELLTEVLRNQWCMPGFVRSDMCAISMLNCDHNVADTREKAVEIALEAGCDVQLYDFPHDFYQGTIIEKVKHGEISMETLDQAVARVLRIKLLAGLFDKPYTNPKLMLKTVRCEQHLETALEVARKGICLLKNDGILPLKKGIKKIALIGPSVKTARLGDYSSRPKGFEPITLWDAMQKVSPEEVQLSYAKGCEILENEVSPFPADWLDGGLTAEYFNNGDLSGEPSFIRTDPSINFNWIFSKPAEAIDATMFSVRWKGTLTPQETMQAYIGLSSFDSMRLYIDGTLFIDNWKQEPGQNRDINTIKPFEFITGKPCSITIEYRCDNRGARVVFGYSYGNNRIMEAAALAKEADIAILALGDSEETSGENFDRADLNLPGKQLELLKAVYATKTPVVLVLQNGRPMSLTWENQHLNAIINAWFPGEMGGQAIAEILWGNVNPSGKLPMSFPKSVGQLPVHYNRKPAGGKRYIEMDKYPLYSFGYGLSYTEFEYNNFAVSAQNITLEQVIAGEKIVISVDVTNTGGMDGDEIIQLYLTDCFASVVRNEKDLRGFQRISLRKGETKRVKFELGFYEMRVLNREFEWVTEKGQFKLYVGKNSTDKRFETEFYVV